MEDPDAARAILDRTKGNFLVMRTLGHCAHMERERERETARATAKAVNNIRPCMLARSAWVNKYHQNGYQSQMT
jgi:hypothetical protein